MPRSCLALAAVFFAFGLLCPQVCAAGNVLVPSDDDSSIDGQQSKSAPTLPAENSDSSTLPSSDYAPPPEPVAAPQQIREMPAPIAESTSADAGPAKSLAIGMAKKNSWGPGDIAMIQSVVGMEPAEVPKRCALSAAGMVRSDNAAGIYPYDLGTTPDAFVNYDGKVKDVSVRLHALCSLKALPPNAGYVMRVGDKYSIYLNAVSCDPPPDHIQRVTISYAGDGNGKCVYE